jgi:hypothetical protein
MWPTRAVCRKIFPLQTANIAYFQIIIQLSGFSAYPDGSPFQLIQASGVILYLDIHKLLLLTEKKKKKKDERCRRTPDWNEVPFAIYYVLNNRHNEIN